MDDDQRRHLTKVLQENRRRLFALEEQAAQFGLQTPSHIRTEIDDIHREITRLQTQLGKLPLVLPAAAADFRGRKAEIAGLVQALNQAVERGSVATISGVRGMGGIGKTELALTVAQLLRDTFSDGQLFVDLRGTSNVPLPPTLALQTIIYAFDPLAILPDDVAQLRGTYHTFLSDKHILILADDAKDVTQVKPLLPPPGSALLITTRQRFTLPGMAELDLETLPSDDAEKMLLKICPRIGSYAAQLAEACGYLPLALRVSAGLLQSDDTQDIKHFLDRLADERSKLAALRDPDDTELDVEASLKLSYDALEPDIQEALCQLSVLPASFDLPTAETVVKTQSGAPVEELLGTLRRRSLLEWDVDAKRYGLHDLVRAFGSMRLTTRPSEQPQLAETNVFDNQIALLQTQRRRLALVLQEQARLGAYAPTTIALEIEDTQAAIRTLKEALRAAGLMVEDESNDEAKPAISLTHTPLSPQEQRNRRAMLTKVRSIWLEGLLYQSLTTETRITLNLMEHPEAVALPLNATVQQVHQPQTQPLGTRIIDVFDRMSGELLILGSPGSGKTTLILELTRDLIARAEHDENFPFPVVFNLSSWSAEALPLGHWLVEELHQGYQVPRKIAETWVNSNLLILLLDGLDEVMSNQRAACVDAINHFRAKHELVPVVVTSRMVDYELIGRQLQLTGAVVIQSLANPQIDEYLARADQLSALRMTVQRNSELRELANSPLMLRIMEMAYREHILTEEIENWTTETVIQQLFHAYVQSMFQRRGANLSYSQAHINKWLEWLAERMVSFGQTIFHIERLQPNWLSTVTQRRQYNIGVRATTSLIVGGSAGLIVGFTGGISIGLASGIAIAFISAVFVGIIADISQITLVEALNISPWRIVLLFLATLVIGLFGGWVAQQINNTLIVALFAGLVAGLVAGAIGLFTIREVPVHTKPNQGIRASAQSALVAGSLSGIASGMIFGLASALTNELSVAMMIGAISGAYCTILTGLRYGGFAVIQHVVLRAILVRNDVIPWNIVRFLDYAAERILLRKVGGGYIFIHRMLMEYFAALEPSTHNGVEKVEPTTNAGT